MEINPAIGTRWKCFRRGTLVSLTVIGIWGEGVSDRYQVTAYDLKPDDDDGEVYMVDADKMRRWIRDRVMVPAE